RPHGSRDRPARRGPLAEGSRMSLFEDDSPDHGPEGTRPDPRERPEDPVGTKPRHDPKALLPHERESLLVSRTADPTGEHEPNPDEVATEAAPELSTAGTHAPHAARFQFVYGVLIGVAIAALAAAVIAFSQNDKTHSVE